MCQKDNTTKGYRIPLGPDIALSSFKIYTYDHRLPPQVPNNMVVHYQLKAGQYLISSNKRYILTMQHDGNLVLTKDLDAVLWDSGTWKSGDGCFLTIQGDGNLVLYNKNGQSQWVP